MDIKRSSKKQPNSFIACTNYNSSKLHNLTYFFKVLPVEDCVMFFTGGKGGVKCFHSNQPPPTP